MGAPIADMLIAAIPADRAHAVEPCRAATVYDGAVTIDSAAFVFIARMGRNTMLIKEKVKLIGSKILRLRWIILLRLDSFRPVP